MNAPLKRYAKEKGKQYNYLYFDHVKGFNAFVDNRMTKLLVGNEKVYRQTVKQTQKMIEKQSDWYGTPPPQSIRELEEHTRFLRMDLLKQIRPKVEKHLKSYLERLSSHEMPLPTLDYNDKGLGLFSFDRAGMGLYKKGELKLDTPIEKTSSQLQIELGHYGIGTSVKKVFAYYKHKQVHYPSLSVSVLAGANAGTKGNELYYIGLALAELVKFMEERGVAVQIKVMIGTSYENTVFMSVIRLKRFQDNLDLNQLLLLSSDARYYRFRGFKALIAMSDYFGSVIPSDLGKDTEDMGKEFLSVVKKEEDGNTQEFVFEQSFSLEAATKEVIRIIRSYHQKIQDEKKA